MNSRINGFEHKISLGQNFLTDEQLLRHLVAQTQLTPEDTVLEIGAGRGEFSLVLAECCKKVVTIEIDSRLEPILRECFSGMDKVRLVMGDVMELDLNELMHGYGAFHVAANLPYYLTTPILNLLFHSALPIRSVSVMVQQEAAQRVLASPGTPSYGPLAVAVQYKSSPRAALKVPASAFSPPPKVDSVFLVMPFLDKPAVSVGDEETFYRVVAAAFAMRRKTMLNNLVKAFHFTREQGLQCLKSAGLPENIRGERLTLDEFARLTGTVLDESSRE